MEEEIRVKLPKDNEIFGIVESMLGSNKLMVRCQDEKIRICRIPGKIRKRVWIRESDVVIVRPWDIQGDTRGDIIWRYRPTEASWLRRKNMVKI